MHCVKSWIWPRTGWHNRLVLYRFQGMATRSRPIRRGISGIVASQAELTRYKTELASAQELHARGQRADRGVKARLPPSSGRCRPDEPLTRSGLRTLFRPVGRIRAVHRGADALRSALRFAAEAPFGAFVGLAADDLTPIIVSFLVCGLLAYGLLMLIGAAIREHARI